jgi:hypothetical protein
MKRLLLFTAAAALAAVVGLGSATAAPPATCTAGLVIFTTNPGDVSVAGHTTHFRESGVGGAYTSGFLAGSTLSGAQNIERNDATGHATLEGEYTTTAPGGTLTIHYTGQVDLATGAATGHFTTVGGTGQFSDFHWNGDITAQLVSLTPPTFTATDSGFCHGSS